MARGGKPKGSPRTGGRAKGVPNKKTLALMEACMEIGIDPFKELCHWAKGDWRALGYAEESRVIYSGKDGDKYEMYVEPDRRIKALIEVCGYLYPKRKAIEHSSDPEKPMLHGVVTPELVKELIESARAEKNKPSGEEM